MKGGKGKMMGKAAAKPAKGMPMVPPPKPSKIKKGKK